MGNCSAIKEGILLMIRILRWSFVMIILTFGQLLESLDFYCVGLTSPQNFHHLFTSVN